MAKQRGFILGPKAGMFFDPMSRLKVLPTHTKENPALTPPELEGKITKRIDIALKNGHIIEVISDAANTKSVQTAPPVSGYESWKDAKLVKYYNDNYEVSEKDLAAFKAMSKADKIKVIEAADKAAEEAEEAE